MTIRLNPPARLAAALVALGATILAPQALAQSAMASQSFAATGRSATVRVDLTGGATSQTVALPAGQSANVELPVEARDVLVTNPLAADVVLRSPRHISILGLKAGATDAVFFDAANRRILTLSIHVSPDTTAISDLINRLLPGATVRVDGLNDSIILSGQVATLADADKAVLIARAQVDKAEKVDRDHSGPQVINMLSIAGKDQVMLKVRVVEVQRNVVKQLGFNLQALVGRLGESQFGFAQAATYAINGQLLGGTSGGYQVDTTKGGTAPGSNGLNRAEAAIQAFERVGLVRTLAEPNLTAVSGESAKFLAGGEFPVPVGRDLTGQVTVDFKPYGVGLGFTPIVLSGGRISLKISTEVSELSTTGAFSLGFGATSTTGSNSTTLVVPSLIVRRAETTVELPSGGAMMIAGLLQDTSKQNIDGIPGLKEVPVLGALFRSRDYLAGQTEMVVIVTPYIVTASNPADLQTPADGLRIANDTDTILMGRLNRAYNRPPEATAGRSYQGPVGYVIE